MGYTVDVADGILSGLNPRQREAVEATSGPVLIVAGPGSGKTRVITHRIAHLIDAYGVSPYRIAAVTFTNKAAREMRERAAALARPRADQLTISTFHAFCASVLRREGDRIGVNREFTIYDRSDQVSLMKRAMQEIDVDDREFRPANALSAISSAKSRLIGVEGYGLSKTNYLEEIVHRAYGQYEELLLQASALDFDDLLFKTYVLFREHEDVVERYRDRYVHVMVDEFQDTNTAQYEIAKQLAGHYRNLCVVGDPDQSIYSWRNADVGNIMNFRQDFPDAKLITLEQNYRSTETILQAAQGVIASNKHRVEKSLFTENGAGTRIVVHEGYDENEEAQFVVREVERLTGPGLGYERSDIAVMYRVNAQSRALEEACMRYGAPYHLVGSVRFYQRQEIKDLLCYLRLIANRDDDVSFSRIVNVPARGIGKRTMDELTRRARERGVSLYGAIESMREIGERRGIAVVPMPARSIKALEDFKSMIEGLSAAGEETGLAEFIDLALKRTGYRDYILDEGERAEERLDNIAELRASAMDYRDLELREALRTFLEQVSLVSDADNAGEKRDAITLITLHQAKGLEFPVVFIVGMEEGLLPHRRAVESRDPEDIEEERRLCYVGMTRAKRMLYLVRAFRRRSRGMGGLESGVQSRFLGEIPPGLLTKPDTAPRIAVSDLGRRDASFEQGQRDSEGEPSPRRRDTSFEQGRRGDGSAGDIVKRREEVPVIRRRRRADAGATKAGSTQTLNTGDKVRHKTFGEGIVTAVKPSGGDVELTVAFKDGHGVKRLLLSFAPLEKME